MNEVKTITGRGIPLMGDDIDTDRIIPARFLRCVTFDGLGEHAFADDRAQRKGQHPFDLPQYQGANILVANANFGCGSSREHAPQALIRWGIKVLVGESFAEIFSGNCLANGIPCLTATPAAIEKLQSLLSDSPQTPMAVDLESRQVRCGELAFPVEMGEGARKMLLAGTWDSCGQLIQDIGQIRQTAAHLPYLNWANS